MKNLFNNSNIVTPKISIDQVLGTNYIRYERLVDMVNKAFVGSSANTVNVYIDLYSMLKPLYNNQGYNIEDYIKLTSNIINICAHYREFFRTRYRVESKFFIVYSKNVPYINNQFCYEYNAKNNHAFNSNKLIDDMIANNIELLETLCPYLPDIHFIKGDFESSVIMYDIICRNELIDNSPHIVLTKDIYAYQLVATRDNVIIFRPKKSKGMDISYFINKNNLLYSYLTERKVKINEKYTMLMPEMLTLIMALSSVTERNIKTMLNINTAINMLIDAIKDYKIVNGYNSDMNAVWNALDHKKIKIPQISFEGRVKAIDIAFQHSIFINTPECKDINITNLYDPKTVQDINNRYFANNPLDLNRL